MLSEKVLQVEVSGDEATVEEDAEPSFPLVRSSVDQRFASVSITSTPARASTEATVSPVKEDLDMEVPESKPETSLTLSSLFQDILCASPHLAIPIPFVFELLFYYWDPESSLVCGSAK